MRTVPPARELVEQACVLTRYLILSRQVYLLSNSSIRYLLQYHPFLAEELRMGLEEAIFQQARYSTRGSIFRTCFMLHQ